MQQGHSSQRAAARAVFGVTIVGLLLAQGCSGTSSIGVDDGALGSGGVAGVVVGAGGGTATGTAGGPLGAGGSRGTGSAGGAGASGESTQGGSGGSVADAGAGASGGSTHVGSGGSSSSSGAAGKGGAAGSSTRTGDPAGTAGSGGAWGATGSGGASGSTRDLSKLNTSCDNGACPSGLTPVKFYGLGGTSGPQYCWCTIPCGGDASVCPSETTCQTVYDGPGTVCMR